MATALKHTESSAKNVCEICERNASKYSCPRCNLLYCSLTCYKSEKHLRCSENFYKECVLENLGGTETDDSSKQKMLEILLRNHEEEANDVDDELDSDDEEYKDIMERLQGIDLDNSEMVWNKLTCDERQEFEAFLRSEDVTKLIPKWTPWWVYQSNLVEELEKWESHVKICPKLKQISDFAAISKKQPASCVRFNLINVIAAYAFMTRFFNGEHFDFAREAVSYISNLSLTLKKSCNFKDAVTAVDSIHQECLSCEWILADEENIKAMKEDVQMILAGPCEMNKKFYVLSMLSDLYDLLKSALEAVHVKEDNFAKIFPDSQFPHVKFESRKNVKIYMKKVQYFMAYAKSFL